MERSFMVRDQKVAIVQDDAEILLGASDFKVEWKIKVRFNYFELWMSRSISQK